MRAYIREIVAEQIKELFLGPDIETVLSWWIANEGRKPVVVVGAGFSRNAVYKRTKELVSSKDVPLWPEVARAFADDLRIHDTSGIDPLTLAELHRDGVGERQFMDMLRELLRDDELAPGDAHKALFDFDLEAIVTTNFLDTLLDRDPRCVPIFDDADVARRIEKPRQIEVLYFHGHRSAPTTWVVSRSQYEDLATVRPMLLARVRQLLSQHPVLTVGFSLADPDFHQIYRQISLDMKSKINLGLALLPPASSGELNSEHEASQRRHWERLGIRIARFKEWDGFAKKLARFFGMTNRITLDELKNKVGHPKQSFARRIEIAKSAFEDPKVDKYVETHRGWENAVWRKCVDEEFDPGEKEEIRQKINRYHDTEFGGPRKENEVRVSIDDGASARTSSRESTYRDAPSFESHYIRKDWDLGLYAYHWLMTRRSSAMQLASWLFYRVDHEYWDQRERNAGDADIDIASLLGAVWCTIDARMDGSSNRSYRDDAIRQLKKAHEFLLRYGADEQAKQIEEDIKAFGGQAGTSGAKPLEAAHMKAAFRQMMNGEYKQATEEYAKALQEATCGDDPLLSWLAAWGRHDAYFRVGRLDKRTADEEQQAKAYWRDRKKYGEHPIVELWSDEAERRLNELRKKTIEQLQKRARDRKFEHHGGFSFSDTPHFAWRVFRDLQTRDAPPGLQEQYLKPLLDHGGFSDGETLRLRLQFGIEKTQEWLDEKLDEPAGTTEKARERDRELIDAWRQCWDPPSQDDAKPTQTTLVAAVETMKPLLEVLDQADVGLPLKLLLKVRSELGHVVENHRGWHAIGHVVAKAWRHCATTLRNKESFDAFRAYAANPEDRIAEDELDRRMGELPWYTWMILEIASPDELVDWVCHVIEQRQSAQTGCAYGTIEGIGNALVYVVGNLNAAPQPLSSASWDLVADWCKRAVDGGSLKEHDIDWMGPILNLIALRAAQTGERGSDDAWQKVENTAYDKLRATWLDASKKETTRINASLMVSILWCLSVIMERRDDQRWSAFAEEAWKLLVEEWKSLSQYITNNPFWLPKLGWFLATIIEHDFEGHRAEAGEKLLALWQLSSSVHHAIPRILDPQYWPGDAWWNVINYLRQGIGGARGTFSASWRIAISSLLRQALIHRKGILHGDLWFLVEHVALLVMNEEAIVANHAAYTTVFCGEVCTDEECDRDRAMLIVKTLEAMASDIRMPVRQAAAYAGGRLPRTAQSKRIIECAKRIRETLEKESYMMIQTQIKLGEAEAAAVLRQARARSSG